MSAAASTVASRFLTALPLLATTILLVTGGAPIYWPLGLALVALVSVILRVRFTLTTFGALLWMIAGASLPILWARATTADIGLGLPVALVLSGMAAVRLFFATPLFGRGFDRALVGFVCIAEGLGVKSAAYPWVAVLVALALLVENAGGVAALRAVGRTPRAAVAVIVFGGALAVLTGFALPALDRATNRRFQSIFEGRIRRTAFSAHVRLDQPGLISTSDEIVLRLHGAETDYLRGAVFDTFDGSYWTLSARGAARDGSVVGPATGAPTEVDAAEASVWLFAPRNSVALGDTPWAADTLGARRPTDRRGATHWEFAPTSERVEEPSDFDRKLPASLLEAVRPLALEWTADAKTDRERLDALAFHLQHDFTYTLDRPKPPPGKSELVDFLFVHREGHCEFFASAFAVLARALGIPSRLVAGFRVVEHNGFGGYAVVRARHAHAWVEAWVPDAATGASHFEVFDATPPGVPTLEETNTRTTSAFFDYLRFSIVALYDAAVAHPERSIPVLGGIIVIALIARTIRNRRRRGDGIGAERDVLPPSFVRFEAYLAEQGFVRERSETLEALAERLAAADRTALAAAVRRYARARYGRGSASETELAKALEVTS